MAADSSLPHTYTVTFRAGRYALAVLMAILGLVLIAISSQPAQPGAPNAVLPGVILLAGCAYVAYSTAITHLTVSAHGLGYRGVGGSLSANWDQLGRIYRKRTRYGQRTVLTVNNSREQFPLYEFGGDWRTTQLARDLQAYAPRLFADKDNPALI